MLDVLERTGAARHEAGVVFGKAPQEMAGRNRIWLKCRGVKGGVWTAVPMLVERLPGCEGGKRDLVVHERLIEDDHIRSHGFPPKIRFATARVEFGASHADDHQRGLRY